MTASASRSKTDGNDAIVVGVPRERKVHERRVAMTPAGVRRLVKAGARVLIEKKAGVESGFADREYADAGATLATQKQVWKRADLIVKVKELMDEELPLLEPGQTLLSYLHLAPNPKFARALLEKSILAIDYEHVETGDGARPLLHPMSDIAGTLSVTMGTYFLSTHPKSPGVLLGGLSGDHAGKVVIIGAGYVGLAAARTAVGLEARVTVLDLSEKALERVRKEFGEKVRAIKSNPKKLAAEIRDADLVVGAVYKSGEAAPKVVTEEMVASMRAGAMIVDVAIDQGGCVATSRPTTHEDPVYVARGVIHYAVSNMPGTVPHTSTRALTAATLPYVEKVVKLGPERAIAQVPELARAVNTREGRLVHAGVARSLPELVGGTRGRKGKSKG